MIVVVGLSHRSAPLEIRERIALSDDDRLAFLKAIAGKKPAGEAMIISTCNRVEVVAAAADVNRANLEAVADVVLSELCALSPKVRPYLYTHVGTMAVRHLFRVAASLDSLVLGEPQILGQVKEAYDFARAASTVGPKLNRVVPRAIRSAKRVRTETTIGSGQVSVPSVGVDLAVQIFGNLRKHTAALVGTGEMGEAVARLLRQSGAGLVVLGRNPARTSELAQALGAEPRPMTALDATLIEADVVVTATSAPSYVIEHERVVRSRRARRGRSLFFIDLAVPRDVDPRVEELDGVFLYNVDDLSRVVAQTLSSRQKEAERAEEIVANEVLGYDRWAESEQVTPVIVALRERLRSVLESELDRSLSGKLKHLAPPERETLIKMTEATLNKMLHNPTIRLRQLAADAALRAELVQYLSMLSDLFDLSGATIAHGQPALDEPTPPSESPAAKESPGPRNVESQQGR